MDEMRNITERKYFSEDSVSKRSGVNAAIHNFELLLGLSCACSLFILNSWKLNAEYHNKITQENNWLNGRERIYSIQSGNPFHKDKKKFILSLGISFHFFFIFFLHVFICCSSLLSPLSPLSLLSHIFFLSQFHFICCVRPALIAILL